jgi:hypothetical protein
MAVLEAGLKKLAIARWLVPLSRWWGLLLMVLVLSGCVDSTVGIRFDHATQGEIVQQIQFGERLKNFGGSALEDWSQAVKERASSLGGEVTYTTEQGLTAKIPFTSSADLEQKFNQFFGTVLNQDPEMTTGGLSTIAAHLTVEHGNWLVAERDRLVYEIDLRSLGFASAQGEVLVSPANLINLEFQLETPWGARNYYGDGMNRPRVLQAGHKLIWTLIPGKQNLLETVFWLPSPLGIGTVGIILLVALGLFLKSPPPIQETASPNSKPA